MAVKEVFSVFLTLLVYAIPIIIAVKTPLKNKPRSIKEFFISLFQFFFYPKGRISIGQYWTYITSLWAFVLTVFFLFVSNDQHHIIVKVLDPKVLIGIFIVTNLFSTIIAIKRLHDVNKSGWWSILRFIPLFDLYPIILMMFFSGDRETNKFGEPSVNV